MLARLVCLSDKCVSLVSVLAWLVCFCVFNPDKCVCMVSKLALFFYIGIGYILPTVGGYMSFGGCQCSLREQGWGICIF